MGVPISAPALVPLCGFVRNSAFLAQAFERLDVRAALQAVSFAIHREEMVDRGEP